MQLSRTITFGSMIMPCLLAIGCGATSSTATTTTVTATVTVVQAAPGAAPVGQATLGEPQSTSAGVRATTLAFENPSNRPVDPIFAGMEAPRPWAVLDAELCATTAPIAKTGSGFSVIDAENREYKQYTGAFPALPHQPPIGLTGDLAPGECARGFVSFALPDGVRPVAIRWDYPGGGGPLRWALP